LKERKRRRAVTDTRRTRREFGIKSDTILESPIKSRTTHH